jgi:hypothetical protein
MSEPRLFLVVAVRGWDEMEPKAVFAENERQAAEQVARGRDGDYWVMPFTSKIRFETKAKP